MAVVVKDHWEPSGLETSSPWSLAWLAWAGLTPVNLPQFMVRSWAWRRAGLSLQMPGITLNPPRAKLVSILGTMQNRLKACTLLLALCFPSLLRASDVKSLLEQARVFENAENYADAERIYRQALEVGPNDLEVLKRFGILYQTELKFPESI